MHLVWITYAGVEVQKCLSILYLHDVGGDLGVFQYFNNIISNSELLLLVHRYKPKHQYCNSIRHDYFFHLFRNFKKINLISQQIQQLDSSSDGCLSDWIYHRWLFVQIGERPEHDSTEPGQKYPFWWILLKTKKGQKYW